MFKPFILILFLSVPLWAGAQTPSAQIIKADANLHRVDARLYRSEQLTLADRDAIRQTPIRSIINLRYWKRNSDQRVFTPRDDIRLLNYPLLTWRVKTEDIAQILWQIEQAQQNGAVLLHCYHGADRTGIVVAFYRAIYHNWTAEQAKAEMMNGGYGYHSVWKNLENLLNDDNINAVRERLHILRLQAA